MEFSLVMSHRNCGRNCLVKFCYILNVPAAWSYWNANYKDPQDANSNSNSKRADNNVMDSKLDRA